MLPVICAPQQRADPPADAHSLPHNAPLFPCCTPPCPPVGAGPLAPPVGAGPPFCPGVSRRWELCVVWMSLRGCLGGCCRPSSCQGRVSTTPAIFRASLHHSTEANGEGNGRDLQMNAQGGVACMRGGICCGLGQLLVVPAGVGALTLTASAEWRGGGAGSGSRLCRTRPGSAAGMMERGKGHLLLRHGRWGEGREGSLSQTGGSPHSVGGGGPWHGTKQRRMERGGRHVRRGMPPNPPFSTPPHPPRPATQRTWPRGTSKYCLLCPVSRREPLG